LIPVQAWIHFFRVYFHSFLSCVHNCDDELCVCLHTFNHCSNIWYSYTHLQNQFILLTCSSTQTLL